MDRLPSTELGSPRRPEMDDTKGGAFAVVGARESRAQGEGKQEDGRLARRRSDLWTWITRPRPGYSAFNANSISGVRQIPKTVRDMWGWVTDLRTLRHACDA